MPSYEKPSASFHYLVVLEGIGYLNHLSVTCFVLGQAKKKKMVLRPLFSNQMRQAGFFLYFQSNIRHMCSTLLKTSLLLFGMLVSSAYGSGNDVLREEVMSTSKALCLLCIEGDWSFTFKVLLLLLSLPSLFDQIKP